MKNKDYNLIKLKILIDKLERRLIVFKERLIREFISGNISIDDIINRGYLKLFNRVESDSFFQEIDHSKLNYEELNSLVKLHDKNTCDTLKTRFIPFLKEKICVIIDNYLKRKNAIPEYLKKFLEIKGIWRTIESNIILQISEIRFEINNALNQTPLSELILLIKDLSNCDYLFDLISIDAIKNLESQYNLA